MEAVALSTATSALNSIVKTATTAITNKIGLLLGVQEELFFIKEELEMMRAFLRVASTQKVKGEVVTTWIKQVQELAFDVEDCLQEASLHLMKTSCLPFMCSVKNRDHIAREIRVLKTRIEDVSKRNLRYNLINKDNDGHIYDESASTRLIANVEALLVGLDEPRKKLVELILEEHGEVISVVGMGGLGKTTLVREVYGCQEVRDEFKHFAWVTVPHPFNMEEFIGNLYKQTRLDAQEIDNMGATIEGNKKKQELFTRITTKKFMGVFMEEKLDKVDKDHKVKEYLKDKKCLIVLDDLSSVLEWNKIKPVLPMGNGSRIIVTTRLRPLAESISQTSDTIYDIKELSENDAFDLFCKTVYKTTNYHLLIDNMKTRDDHLDENKCNMKDDPISGEIMEEDNEKQKQCMTITITGDMKTEAGLIIKSCGQLPLAIVTIGSYLATKPKTSAEWKTMHDHLSSELGNDPHLGVVNTVLTSSNDGLPYHLKPCLLYLSVFHNHKEIRRSRIIRRWMADGYVMKGRKKTAAKIGKGYFYDLMGRTLIEPSEMSTIVNGDVKRCNIHDMMYKLILAKAMDENIVSVFENGNLITMTDKVRHLVIAGEPCKGDKNLEGVDLSHMRSVSFFGSQKLGNYLQYPRMKLVRVLDLEGTVNLNNQDLRSVVKFRHLKYLGLRGTPITALPDSLGNLNELETLDIRNIAVGRLPRGISKLQKLSYLRAGFDLYPEPYDSSNIFFLIFMLPSLIALGTLKILCWPLKGLTQHDPECVDNCMDSSTIVACCLSLLCAFIFFNEDDFFYTFGVRTPRGIGELRSLNILGIIDIGGSKGLAKELQNLTNLSKLAVKGCSKKNGKALAEVIDGLKHLRSLLLVSADHLGLKDCLHSISFPPKYLQSLKLYNTLGELPNWISFLENLEKIHFRNTYLTKEIKAIEKLPNLKILYLSYNSFEEDVKELCFGEGTFSMLQVMILEGLKELESVSIKKTALGRLEQLMIGKCWSIGKKGVSGLEFLVQLKEMEVVVSESDSESDKTFVGNLQEKLLMLPQKPVLRVSKTESPK